MRAELANHNHCAVPFLSRAAVNLSWYDSTHFALDMIDRRHFHIQYALYKIKYI